MLVAFSLQRLWQFLQVIELLEFFNIREQSQIWAYRDVLKIFIGKRIILVRSLRDEKFSKDLQKIIPEKKSFKDFGSIVKRLEKIILCEIYCKDNSKDNSRTLKE